MAVVETNKVFGVHSIMLHDLSNGFLPYSNSMMKIINNASIATTSDAIALNGGSSQDAWAAEDGVRSNELSLSVAQYEPAMFQRFAGAVMTEISASATGSIVNSLVNTKGTSLVDATTGVASVSIKSGDEADLKEANYFVKVITATTVRISSDTDLGFNNGTDVVFGDQTYVIGDDITIADSGATQDIADLGITLTSGSGTIAMTVGDAAMFTVAPAHAGVRKYSIGENGQTSDYVGVSMWSEKQSDGSVMCVIIPKVKFNGLPLNFNAKEFAVADISGTPVRGCSPTDGKLKIYEVLQIKGVNTDEC